MAKKYCMECGEATTHPTGTPKFCSSCGFSFVTGKKPVPTPPEPDEYEEELEDEEIDDAVVESTKVEINAGYQGVRLGDVVGSSPNLKPAKRDKFFTGKRVTKQTMEKIMSAGLSKGRR